MDRHRDSWGIGPSHFTRRPSRSWALIADWWLAWIAMLKEWAAGCCRLATSGRSGRRNGPPATALSTRCSAASPLRELPVPIRVPHRPVRLSDRVPHPSKAGSSVVHAPPHGAGCSRGGGREMQMAGGDRQAGAG